MKKSKIDFISKWCAFIMFILLALYWLLLFTEGPVKYGRFSEIDNAFIAGIKGLQLVVWTWIAFRLFPKKKRITAIVVLVLGSLTCLFGTGLIETYERQFFNTFILFNIFGVLIFIFWNPKFHTSLLSLLLLIIVAAFLIKPIGIATGITSEHDYVETQYMYFDEEHKIVKSKITKKGYKQLGEKLIYYENGNLKSYENFDEPIGMPWVNFHKNGTIYNIWCKTIQLIDGKKYESLYNVYFDDKGMVSRVTSSFGPVLEYHFNGYVFSSGQSNFGRPYGKWYWYSYEDGSVVDSVVNVAKAPKGWELRNHLRTNRYREQDTNTYRIQYDQKLMNDVHHYRPDSLYDFALDIKERFDQNLDTK